MKYGLLLTRERGYDSHMRIEELQDKLNKIGVLRSDLAELRDPICFGLYVSNGEIGFGKAHHIKIPMSEDVARDLIQAEIERLEVKEKRLLDDLGIDVDK